EAVNKYPIALVSASTKKDYGQKWIDLVLSTEGQAILEEAGFTPAAK
ncbi:MAG: substrate-binding domain-containing protein, partial [Pauljensenia sp.]|nr:substrate-binding domain-containing protein [Pauljensenia sp.]